MARTVVTTTATATAAMHAPITIREPLPRRAATAAGGRTAAERMAPVERFAKGTAANAKAAAAAGALPRPRARTATMSAATAAWMKNADLAFGYPRKPED